MPLPDPGVFRDLARDLRALAVAVAGERRSAETTVRSTVWVSPAADRARRAWSQADGHARTSDDELQAAATHLDRLAAAVDDLRADMEAAHARARQGLLDARRTTPDGPGLPPQLVQAELRDLRPAGDPSWAQRVGAPPVRPPSLPGRREGADPGPTAPAGTVITDPAATRTLAGRWHDVALAVGGRRAALAVRAVGLPLAALDAYGLPGRSTGALLEDVLGPSGAAAAAVTAYTDAATAAVQAADAIDGLGTGFLASVGGMPIGTAQSALQTLLDSVDLLDTAGHGGEADGVISLDDLRAAADDASLPADVRAAARLLADDEVLRGLVEDMDASRLPGHHDGKFRAADLADLIALRSAAEQVYAHLPLLAQLSGQPQGTVNADGLRAAASSTSDPALREAARWLVDHPHAVSVLGRDGQPAHGYDGVRTTFGATSLQALLIDSHAFAGRPDDARRFVATLPSPGIGDRGFPLDRVGDRGVQALANAALTAVAGDLSEQVAVIGRLPETGGGVRNALISAMYARMGFELDRVLNGASAGDPTAPGHTGANWMLLAPWASDGVRDPITGDFRALGVPAPYGARQAAADGNQWIFSDIGARYAAFLELYREGAAPSTGELQGFFDRTFGEGDDHIRTGFAAYAEAMTSTDPLRRQQLVFQGNTLIAVHEQAGAQPWLERVSVGPDALATEFIELRVGARTLQVSRDLPPPTTTLNNLVVDRDFLSLDPGDRTADQLAPTALAGVRLRDLDGVPGSFSTTLAAFTERGGTVPRHVPTLSPFPVIVQEPGDADALPGTAARTWTDFDERMYTITRLFEQVTTDQDLYNTALIDVGFDRSPNAWLDPATGLVP